LAFSAAPSGETKTSENSETRMVIVAFMTASVCMQHPLQERAAREIVFRNDLKSSGFEDGLSSGIDSRRDR
jgi:hypothetical protein